jgi:DNA invertase Pin-like site-specific DNA recombinase
MKAYRYARFSHSRQSDGMSLERQKDVAEDWAEAQGVTLDDAYVDAGVSASRGKNIIKGALGRFRAAVEAGDVKAGSWLLVESVSRFSRLGPLDAMPVLRELVEAGITVKFFGDPAAEVTADNIGKMGTGLVLQLMQYMAQSYAETLGDYRAKAWERARGEARKNGTAATTIAPYWLRCEVTDGKRGAVRLDETYAPIVKRIFAEYLTGRGVELIARGLNASGVKAPGQLGREAQAKQWHASLVIRTLSNRAVLGEYQPHKEVKTRITQKGGIAAALKRRREKAGAVIEGYYPAVISPEDFARATAVRASRRPKAGAPRVTTLSTALLARLATCPICGSSIKRENKGPASRVPTRYVCTQALNGKCERVRVGQAAVEAGLVAGADRLREAPGTDPAIGEELTKAEARLAAAEAKVSAAGDSLMAIFEAGQTASAAMNAAHTRLEAARDALKAEVEALRGRSAASQTNVLKARVARMVDALKGYKPADPLGYEAHVVNAALFECFSRVVIDYTRGELVLHWRHGPPPARVKYAG